jgi:UbiD family decarboxylase
METVASYRDLRDWIDILHQQDEVTEIRGASWDLQIGTLIEIACRESTGHPPALLFQDIPGYPRDRRVLGALFSSPKRLALTLGLEGDIATKQEMVAACRKKLATVSLVPPVMVKTGPVAENVLEGADVDLLSFPVPRHHELDGGRYIGTANCVITRDPDDGWVNLGTYRCMVLGPDRFAVHMSPGRDGNVMRAKYHARNEPMPVALAIGVDPALWLASNSEVRSGTSEYDYAGGLKGEPIEVMRGPKTGLPIPARAEIVIEGLCHPGELAPEGPFGEWAGYYANHGLAQVPEPVIRVLGVMHRDAPILTCAHPAKPKNDSSFSESSFRSATMWDEMEKAGVPGIRGVWCHEMGGARLFNVISIKQQYAGHSRQAGMIASQCRSGVYIGRYTVVLDDDIDPSNLADVIWAVSTRSNPERSIEITRWTRSSSADPAVSPYLKDQGSHGAGFYTSKAIIDACWPFEWRQRAYPVVQYSDELRTKMFAEFPEVLASIIR